MNGLTSTCDDIHTMSKQDNAQGEGATRQLTTIKATHGALWQEARDICDDTLARGCAFVAILRGAEAFADAHLLTDEDRQRAARFRQAGDRHNFVLGRSMIHHLVGPRGVSTPCFVSIGAHGKPFLPGASACNLSHSGHWVACAVSRNEPVGIDVETFAHLKDYRGLIPTITHPTERRYIEQATADRRLALFKRCWTRKEAILKATGMGLSDNLQTIDVCLDQSEPVLGHPAPLRLIHLPVDQEQVTIALALNPSVPGVVAMLIAEPI
jgi:phosphopantetheinyl transferase